MGEGDPAFAVEPTLKRDQVALIGARAADSAERAAIERGLGIQIDDPAATLRVASQLYVHVDVDVLEPSEYAGLNRPESGGMTIDELVSSLDSLSRFNVVGAGMTENVGSPDQVEALAPVVRKIGELLMPGALRT